MLGKNLNPLLQNYSQYLKLRQNNQYIKLSVSYEHETLKETCSAPVIYS